MSLEDIDLSKDMFLDYLTVIYGESGSGKSTIIRDIMYLIRNDVNQVIVFAPTDPQNRSYSGNVEDDRLVPQCCIHTRINESILNNIWDRQEALCSTCKRANNYDILYSLASRTNDPSFTEAIAAADEKLIESRGSITNDNELKDLEADYTEFKSAILRFYINKYRRELRRMQLSADEAFTLKYYKINPRLLLIFDDCTEQLSKLKNNEVLEKIAYQGRWAKISTIIACHTDKSIDPAVKKNSYIWMFAQDTSLASYVNRASNDMPTKVRKQIMQQSDDVFKGANRYKKMLYYRKEQKWYKFMATLRDPFKFGDKSLWRFASEIEADDNATMENNRFAGKFK